MKRHRCYLMESDQEALRLDIKTDAEIVAEQAVWAGIKSGMRIADLGCGAGKTTFHLNKLVFHFFSGDIKYTHNTYHVAHNNHIHKDNFSCLFLYFDSLFA